MSVGSPYLNTLIGAWEDQPDGTWGPARTPMQRGIEIRTRDQALRLLAAWELQKPIWQYVSPRVILPRYSLATFSGRTN